MPREKARPFTFDNLESTNCVLIGLDYFNLSHDIRGVRLTEEESSMSVYTKAPWGYRWHGEWYIVPMVNHSITINLRGTDQSNGLSAITVFDAPPEICMPSSKQLFTRMSQGQPIELQFQWPETWDESEVV